MDLSPLDWALRGATAGLLLLLAAVLLRDHGERLAARLGALFAAGSAAYAVTSAAGFGPPAQLWAVPLLALAAGNNVVFWGLAAALFDDGFRLRWWHGALWLLLVVAGTAGCFLASRPLAVILTLSSFAFAVLAIAQVVASWRSDLVEGRRRLRAFVVGGSGLYIGLEALARLAGVGRLAPQEASLTGSLGLLAIAAGIAWALLRVGGAESLFGARPAAAPSVPEVDPPAAAAASPDPVAVDPPTVERDLLAGLERLMTVERAYRQDGLAIADLAGRLGLPEYRLRRLINQGLGHRNFNSFVNGYRIAEARAALADPDQAEVPVLTIALDAGFSSIGPFNRAFKAATGATPSDFRRAALAESSKSAAIPESASRTSSAASGRLAAS